jgi:dTMP kinase
MARGFFVSLDGLDGAGKSTQCHLLATWLRSQGRKVTTCFDPGGTSLGTALRDILLHQQGDLDLWSEALLFMASRAQLLHEVIRPALHAGDIVISDRFFLATTVYQGHAGGLDPDQVRHVGRVAAGGLEPDLTLVLDLPVEMSRSRKKDPADRVESRGTDYQARVREGFLAEARLQPTRIEVIDATLPAQAVQETVRRLVALKMAGT